MRVATLIWVFLALVAVLSIAALLLVKVIQFSIGVIKALRRTEKLCEIMGEAASGAVEVSRQLGADGIKSLPVSCNFQLSSYQRELLSSCKDKEIRYCGEWAAQHFNDKENNGVAKGHHLLYSHYSPEAGKVVFLIVRGEGLEDEY